MPTKSFSLTFLALFITSCSSTLKPHVLNESRTLTCQEEIEVTISSLIQAKNLTLSKDVFSKTSTLYLTNQKNSVLKKSPIYNDLRGRKTLMLYKKQEALYVGLINKKEEVEKEKELKNCF